MVDIALGANGVHVIRNVALDLNIGREHVLTLNPQAKEKTALVLAQQLRRCHAKSEIAKVSSKLVSLFQLNPP